MAIQGIRDDPNWDNGNYTREPIEGLRSAADMFIIAGSAPQQMQKDLPTRKKAEAYFNQRVDRLVAYIDADDLIYQFDASRDYNPEPRLGSISAHLIWINSGDDFINPPELSDIAQKLVRRIPHGRYILIPASMSTYGHGTHTHAAVWKQYLVELLAESAKH
jgi:homoserine O-acetyltransferase